MSNLDRENHQGRIVEENRALPFEIAESIIEADRPEYLKKLETPASALIRREHTYHFIAAKLEEKGQLLPLKTSFDEESGTASPSVTLTLAEWNSYFAMAAADRAGIKIN